MNAIGIALMWCVVQVTLIGLLAAGLYLAVRKLRPAAASSVVLTGLAAVVVLSLFMLSPWPRWTMHRLTASMAALNSAPVSSGAGQETKWAGLENAAVLHANEGQRANTGVEEAIATTNGPSTAAMFWHALMRELAKPQITEPTTAWHWPAVMAVLLIAAMACGLGWLLLGVTAVRWQRLRSRPIGDDSLLELVDTLRAELGCRRRVEIRQADDLTTAATIGWRRPVLLLPADWTTWTVAQRRAVLAHEIVHARSHDFIALLVGQVGLSLHIYHPLLHWLIGRLRLEQELAADAAAARVSGGQRQYLLTIAELALRRQNRPLSWPARSFLPTQTTFLRRIAMLRDSKLRFDRLSPVARLTTVGAVLLCAVLVAGLRGPGGQPQLLADDRAGAPAAPDSRIVDTSFLIEGATSVVILRPSAAFARPELAPLAKLLERSGPPFGAMPLLPANLRQMTMIQPAVDIPFGPRGIVVLQWIKPAAAQYLAQHATRTHYAVKELNGKKVHVGSDSFGNVSVELVLDDYTLVHAGSEQAMRVYLAGNRGVLPKWLPAKAWEAFRDDECVIAADMASVRDEMKAIANRMPPLAQPIYLSVAPLWEDATGLAAGMKLDDKLTVHAWAAAKDADASVKLRRTVEALQTLAESVVRNFRTPDEAGRQPQCNTTSMLLDEADRLLAHMKLQQEGNDVRLQTSVELDTAGLASLVSAIVEATQPSDASTTTGIKTLVEDFFHHNYRDLTSRQTLEWGEAKKTNDGNFCILYKYRARWWYGEPEIVEETCNRSHPGEQ